MSKITIHIKEEYYSQQSDPDYIPSQTPSSEDYTSYESSSMDSCSSESQYSIANSQDYSGSSDLNSSYYDGSSQEYYTTQEYHDSSHSCPSSQSSN